MPEKDLNVNVNPVETEVDDAGEKPQSKYLTAEDFNRALSNRERAFEKRIAKQQEDFQKLLERFAPPAKEEPQLSRTAELEKTVKELSRSLKDRDERDRQDSLRRTVERSLKSHGIDPEYVDHALAFLVDARKAVKYDSEGNMVMEINGMAYDDIDEGMSVWANSREAKLYKKPTNAKGSGDQNRRGASSNEDSDKITLKRKEGWNESKDINKSSLTKETRIAIQKLIGPALLKR